MDNTDDKSMHLEHVSIARPYLGGLVQGVDIQNLITSFEEVINCVIDKVNEITDALPAPGGRKNKAKLTTPEVDEQATDDDTVTEA